MSDKRSKGTYKHKMKQEDETIITRIVHLPRALKNGLQAQVLSY
jgi:hypothetical protein